MQLKRLREKQEKIAWPSDSNDLPVVSWESCESIFLWFRLCHDAADLAISSGTIFKNVL